MNTRHAMGLLLVALIWMGGLARAEESAKELSPAERARIAKLIEECGAEDFATREAAEMALRESAVAALPLLREHLAATKDLEVKTRLERAVRALALKGESNPEELEKLGRADALGKRYKTAGEFYARAAQRLRAQAESETDETRKAELLARASKDDQRKARAEGLAGAENATEDEDGVFVWGGGEARVRVVVNGRVIGEQEAVDKEGDVDW